ncbi:MAG: hypothetical protein ACOCQD_02800 [archaeon]
MKLEPIRCYTKLKSEDGNLKKIDLVITRDESSNGNLMFHSDGEPIFKNSILIKKCEISKFNKCYHYEVDENEYDISIS